MLDKQMLFSLGRRYLLACMCISHGIFLPSEMSSVTAQTIISDNHWALAPEVNSTRNYSAPLQYAHQSTTVH